MEALNITIRRAGVADADTVTTLSVSTFVDTFAKDNNPEDMASYIATEMSLEKLGGELEDAENLFWLAEADGQPIAYCKMRTAHKPDGPEAKNPIELERIYVAREYHRSGVGQLLLDNCIAYGRANAHDVLWLGVWEHNHKAVGFYRKNGFEQFGSHIFRLGTDDQTDILMQRML